MRTLELELSDGRTLEVDLEEPKLPNKSIDIPLALKEGAKSALNPTSSQIGQGGLDIAQRFGQATLGSIYGQGRSLIQESVPKEFTQSVGQGITSMLPGGMITSNALSPQMQQEIGKQGIGVGVDIGAGLGVGLTSKIGSSIGRGVGNITENIIGAMPNSRIAQSVGQAARALRTSERVFQNQYDTMFSSKGNKFIPNELKEKIRNTIDSVSNTVSPESPFASYLDNLKSRLSRINGKELHALKQEVFSRRTRLGANKEASNNVYDTITDVLSDQKMYGEKYKDITSDYRQFLTKEKGYVEDMIFDKEDNLTAEKLKHGQFTPEQRKAFSRLATRAKVGVDIGKSLSRSRTVKTFGKKAIEYAPWAGGSYVTYRVLKDILK